MGSSAHSSSTKRSARRRTLQRLLPLGGSEQARAIRWASCSPSSLLGLVALGLRWTSAASNPSQANLWRTRATVERLISRASAILVAGQEEASLGASSPSSALSRMRAWVNWRAGAWPPAIKPSSLPRSSLDKLTGLFLFLGIERPPHVRCRAVARTSGGTHHTREGILLQTNHVRTLVFRRFTRVAAPMLWFASLRGPGRSLFVQPPGGPLCELRVRSVPQSQRSVSPAEGEAGAGKDGIPDCKECSSNCEDARL